MHSLFGITFVLFLLKLPAGKGFIKLTFATLNQVKARQKRDHVDVFEKRFFLDKKLLKTFPITKQDKMR